METRHFFIELKYFTRCPESGQVGSFYVLIKPGVFDAALINSRCAELENWECSFVLGVFHSLNAIHPQFYIWDLITTDAPL